MSTRVSKTLIAALALSALLVSAAPAPAVQLLNQTVDIYDDVDDDFISGSGTPINGFVQDSVVPPIPAAINTISVAVRPRDRDTGQPSQLIGDDYYVDRGQSTNNPARPNLAFDFQFDPGADLGNLNYRLRLSLDYDPAVGSSAFTVVELPIFDADGIPDATVDSWIDTDGYYLTNTSGQFSAKQAKAWNDGSVPYVITNTTNHTFLPAPVGFPYSSNTLGEYEIRLEALDFAGTTVLAGATAFAQVVPEPATLGLAGLGLLSMIGVARRRKRLS